MEKSGLDHIASIFFSISTPIVSLFFLLRTPPLFPLAHSSSSPLGL